MAYEEIQFNPWHLSFRSTLKVERMYLNCKKIETFTEMQSFEVLIHVFAIVIQCRETKSMQPYYKRTWTENECGEDDKSEDFK